MAEVLVFIYLQFVLTLFCVLWGREENCSLTLPPDWLSKPLAPPKARKNKWREKSDTEKMWNFDVYMDQLNMKLFMIPSVSPSF